MTLPAKLPWSPDGSTSGRPNAITRSSTRERGNLLVHAATVVCTTVIMVLLSASTSSTGSGVYGAPLLFVQEPKIVSKELLTGVCEDYLGVEQPDLASWTSGAGACDLIVCHVEPSGNYTVTHSCRPREPYENPDSVNCEWVSNTTATFPDCCPELSCGSATPLTTVDPLLCLDLASSFACGFWYNITSGCNDTTAFMYNVSQVYCRNTCGLC